MRNAGDQQGENKRQWKNKSEHEHGKKIFGKHVRRFPHENNVKLRNLTF